jgi:3-phosphoshikimate 1-carboxyvinyltransferase
VSSPSKKQGEPKTNALISGGQSACGALEVPGDKSISHRVAIFSAIASGTSSITGFLQAEDCINTLRALEAIGVETFIDGDGELQITGTGGRFFEPAFPLDFGNSGTGLRLMAGLLASQPFQTELSGDESLSSRPMDRIRGPLEMMGATFEFPNTDNRAPFRVQGGSLTSIDYRAPVASAQVKSCLLIAGLFAEGESVIHEPRRTRDHTERLLRVLDVPIKVDGLSVSVDGFGLDGPDVEATEWYVPGDFSSAANWIVSAAARGGKKLNIENVGLNPRRTAILDVLERMGAEIEVEVISESDVAEPYGDIKVRGTNLKGTEVGGNEIPNLIDELPLVAVAGALAEGETVIRDAAELRVKESDRISAMVKNLKKFGADVEELKDGLIVRGPINLDKKVGVDSYGDHRIAMAMAILGSYGEKPVAIKNIACTETSYPGFWGDLRHQGVSVEFAAT